MDSHAILPYLKTLKVGEKVWNNTIIDLLHMITNPYLHYALFRYNSKTGKCDYDLNSYQKYTNFRFAIDYKTLDEPEETAKKRSKSESPKNVRKGKSLTGKVRSKGSKFKKPKHHIDYYDCIEADIEINDFGKQVAKKEFILTSKSGKVPSKNIDDFLNIHTREFSLLLFLIYERSQGGKDWLSAILSRSGKYPSEVESLIRVLGWCGIEYSETDENFWWNDYSKRRWLVREINKKAEKAGIDGDLIELTTEPENNTHGEPIRKRVGKKNESYMLSPGLRAKINIPLQN